jgi:hypothetical protein
MVWQRGTGAPFSPERTERTERIKHTAGALWDMGSGTGAAAGAEVFNARVDGFINTVNVVACSDLPSTSRSAGRAVSRISTRGAAGAATSPSAIARYQCVT